MEKQVKQSAKDPYARITQEHFSQGRKQADKTEVCYAVADAYSANRQYRTGLKVLRKKIELFGADAGDYLLTAIMLENASDVEGMKRELRGGIMFGVRRFAKEHLPESRETARALGQMFDRLHDRQDAAQWFDISLVPDWWWPPNATANWTEYFVKTFPKWYQSERSVSSGAIRAYRSAWVNAGCNRSGRIEGTGGEGKGNSPFEKENTA